MKYLILILILSASCSSLSYIEDVTTPDIKDRYVIGYNKSKTKYKVKNGYGKHAEPIKIVLDSLNKDTLKPGDFMIYFE